MCKASFAPAGGRRENGDGRILRSKNLCRTQARDSFRNSALQTEQHSASRKQSEKGVIWAPAHFLQDIAVFYFQGVGIAFVLICFSV